MAALKSRATEGPGVLMFSRFDLLWFRKGRASGLVCFAINLPT
jgi:hypothetical protein